jgi:hypothetical protein
MSEGNPAPARTRSTPGPFFCPWGHFHLLASEQVAFVLCEFLAVSYTFE